jgi:hypothetical protein
MNVVLTAGHNSKLSQLDKLKKKNDIYSLFNFDTVIQQTESSYKLSFRWWFVCFNFCTGVRYN